MVTSFSWITGQLIQAYHQYGVGSRPFCMLQQRGTRLAADKVYQLLADSRWFSPGTPASSITKTCHHAIAEILLKVVLSTNIKSNNRFVNISELTKSLMCTICGYSFRKYLIMNLLSYSTALCNNPLPPLSLHTASRFIMCCLISSFTKC
jgi:hypothetical protein